MRRKNNVDDKIDKINSAKTCQVRWLRNEVAKALKEAECEFHQGASRKITLAHKDVEYTQAIYSCFAKTKIFLHKTDESIYAPDTIRNEKFKRN